MCVLRIFKTLKDSRIFAAVSSSDCGVEEGRIMVCFLGLSLTFIDLLEEEVS